MNLYLDIETVPSSTVTVEGLLVDVKSPGNLKDPVKIEAARKEKAQEMFEKAGLDALTGRILCIGYAIDGQEPVCLYAHGEEREADVLQDFFDQVSHTEHYGGFSPHVDLESGSYLVLKRTVVGFNICGFDLPFITRRASLLGVEIPSQFPTPFTKKWDERILDLMLAWCGQDKYVSFERLCRAYGIKVKTDLAGHEVRDAYLRGEHDRIRSYNLEDLTALRELHCRMSHTNFLQGRR